MPEGHQGEGEQERQRQLARAAHMRDSSEVVDLHPGPKAYGGEGYLKACLMRVRAWELRRPQAREIWRISLVFEKAERYLRR